MQITLNDAEQRLARFLAQSRHKNARNRGITDAKIGDQSAWATDLEGIAAEIAFCKLKNVFPDTETNLPASDLPDADALVEQLGSVDVKATKVASGHLLVRPNKTGKNIDTFALMIGECPTYRYAGWITAEELLRDETLKDFGYGDTHAMTQKDLNYP